MKTLLPRYEQSWGLFTRSMSFSVVLSSLQELHLLALLGCLQALHLQLVSLHHFQLFLKEAWVAETPCGPVSLVKH